MFCIADAPDIALALHTGYGFPVEDESDYDPDEPIFITDEGEMDKAQVIDYMTDYIKSNTTDAADALGIKIRWRV